MSVPWYLMAKGKGGGGYKTASGPIVSVSDALAAPLRSLIANIDPVQDLHGYDNPWPAGGGKNKTDYTTDYVPTVGVNNGIIMLFRVTLKAGTYTFSCKQSASVPTSVRNTLAVVVGNGSYQYENTIADFNPPNLRHSKTFTVEEESNCDFYIWSNAPSIAATYSEWQVEESASFTSYAPYSNICPISGWSAVNVWVKPTYDPTANPTATLQLGQTVYGGTLDVTNGVLTVERAMVDLGTLTWVRREDVGPSLFSSSTFTDYLHSADIKVLCSVYSYKGTVSAVQQMPQKGDKELCLYYNSNLPAARSLYVNDTAYTDAATFTTAMSGVQLVYELATPITIPLTPQEISTLQGQNNVWADSGDVTVTYLSSGGANADLMKLAVAFMGKGVK